MKKLLLLPLLLVSIVTNAQKLSFDYDNAGNQIQRSWCTTCHSRTSNEVPKEISKLKEEDLQKFFPEDVISYYPNPVKEELYLKWELINENKVTSIQVYALNGQIIKDISKLESTNSQTVIFQDYPKGIYLLQLNYTNGDEKTIKIIKE